MPNIYTVEHRVVEVEGIDDLTLKYRVFEEQSGIN